MLSYAKWIRCGKEADSPVFFRSFELDFKVKNAVLSITAAGVYEARLNGERVGEFFLAPGWTVYRKRLQVQRYDVTELLKAKNELSVTVGSGWYSGRIARECKPADPAVMLLAELEITADDGSVHRIVTDSSWLSAQSAVRFSDIYDGEEYDAAFSDSNPVFAVEKDFPKTQLIKQEGEEIRLQDELKPVRVIHTPRGETVVDFGQEITGIVRLTVRAKQGDIITLSCAEVLDNDGNFYNANYRSARSRMILHCKDGEQTWQPMLTFYGFRYLKVEGWPGDFDPQSLTAIVVCSDIKRTGTLLCGNQKLNRLFSNIVWGQRGNFVDVPTDCPQRDERLGWTGDAQVFINTACYQFDTKKFYTKWLEDVKAEQRPNGGIPDVVPGVRMEVDSDEVRLSCAWTDAATVCPWELYRHYGDRELLASHFDMMRRWVDCITSVTTTPNLWTGYNKDGFRHYGDWLGLDAEEGSYVGSSDRDFLASAYYAYSTSLVLKAGRALGIDVSEYEKLYENIKNEFKKTYSVCKTQTECAVALFFDLAYDKKAVAGQLAKMVRENGNRLTTGFVGTPYLLYALSQNGYTDVAYSLLTQEKFPSWLYSVNNGATTIWEHWDSRREDGTFWSTDMNSFNHYAYGSVAGWVFEEAAGIRPAEDGAGFTKLKIEPKPDARLGWLRASLKTPHGEILSEWTCEEDRIRYSITVPVEASIVIDGKEHSVKPGTYMF